MSTSKEVTVWCDGFTPDGVCQNWTVGSGNNRTVTAARRDVRDNWGWTRKGDRDLCPECSNREG